MAYFNGNLLITFELKLKEKLLLNYILIYFPLKIKNVAGNSSSYKEDKAESPKLKKNPLQVVYIKFFNGGTFHKMPLLVNLYTY